MGIGEKLHLGEKEKKLVLRLGAVALAALCLLLVGNMLQKEEKDPVQDNAVVSERNENILKELENDLEAALGKIDGAGAVTVEIKWAETTTKDYAYNSEESFRLGEGETETERSNRNEMVLTDGNKSPVLLKESLPGIEGVLIVAAGAYDPQIRETLLSAAATFLHVGANRIQIARKG